MEIENKYKNKKTIVAVSTGIDSMVLLHLMKNENIIIVHVNHKKRLQSEKEQTFIKNYAKENNIPIRIYTLPPNEESNFQEYAHTMRYKFFAQAANETNATQIMTAHHGDDLIESMMMNITRGTGIEGLHGISESTFYNNINVIRPLLKYSKKNISDYQKKNNIKFFSDDSNTSNTYTRNRFRKHLLPFLHEEQLNVHQKFFQLSQEASEISQLLKNKVKLLTNDISEYTKQLQVIRYHYLKQLLQKYNVELSRNVFSAIEELLFSSRPNGYLNITETLQIQKSYNKIHLKERQKSINEKLTIHKFGTYEIFDNKITICEKEIQNKKNCFKICYNKQVFPITIRTRQLGDRIKLSFGSKKIKSLLIDKKIPMDKRDKTLLLETNNQIVALLDFKITSKTNGNKCIFVYYDKGGNKNA